MQKLTILNSKQIKQIKTLLTEQYGFYGELDYAFFVNSKGKVYILNKEIKDFDFSRLRIDVLGLYFGTIEKYDNQNKIRDKTIRLTIEGSQLIGKKAKKNVVEIPYNLMRLWMKGFDIEFKHEAEGNILLKCGSDFLGTGKKKGKQILNYIPKSRYILCDD